MEISILNYDNLTKIQKCQIFSIFSFLIPDKMTTYYGFLYQSKWQINDLNLNKHGLLNVLIDTCINMVYNSNVKPQIYIYYNLLPKMSTQVNFFIQKIANLNGSMRFV